MKKKEVVANYRMPQAALAELGDKAVTLMERDATELAGYGADEDVKDFISGKTDDFKDAPTDEEMRGDITVATAAKDTAASSVKELTGDMMTRVNSRFGKDSGQAHSFGTAGMDALTDSDLVRCGRRVVRRATLYLSDLAVKGVDTGMIGTLNTAVLLLDDNIDAKDDTVRAQDIATQTRIDLGNELYDKVVEVFGFGKEYWDDKDEAKYNDYVIYNTPTGTPEPAEGTTDFRLHVVAQGSGGSLNNVPVSVNPGSLSLTSNSFGLTPVQNKANGSVTVAVSFTGYQPFSQAFSLTGGNMVFEILLIPV